MKAESSFGTIASLFPKYFLNEKATYILTEIVEMEYKLHRNDLIYETGNKKKDKDMIFKSLKQ